MNTRHSAQLQSADAAGKLSSMPDHALPPTGERNVEAGAAEGREALDVRSLQRRLEQEIVPDETKPAEDAVASPKGKPVMHAPTFRRIGKFLLGASVLAVFGVIPLRTLLQTSSVEAVVNARLNQLRPPHPSV